jgi:hypothetical protein
LYQKSEFQPYHYTVSPRHRKPGSVPPFEESWAETGATSRSGTKVSEFGVFGQPGPAFGLHSFDARVVVSERALRTKTGQRGIWLVIGVAAVYAAVQISRGVYVALTGSNDFHATYEFWKTLLGHQLPDAPYLPLTYVCLTPFFCFGFPVGKCLMLAFNIALVLFIWRRVVAMWELTGMQQLLFLVLFGDWCCVRVTLGHGQTPLLVLALILLALPIGSKRDVPLGLSSMKQTLIFPLYLAMLFRNPRRLIIPALMVFVSVALVMIWTKLDPKTYIQLTAEHSSERVRGTGDTDLSVALRTTLGNSRAAALIVWLLWLCLFCYIQRTQSDERLLLVSWLIMSLWPLYHRFYDLVVLAPALGLLLKRAPLAYPLALTLSLGGLYEHLTKHGCYGSTWLAHVMTYYYPVVLFALLGVVTYWGRIPDDGSRHSAWRINN